MPVYPGALRMVGNPSINFFDAPKKYVMDGLRVRELARISLLAVCE